MKKVSDLFNIQYGVNLEYYKMEESDTGIPFIARGSTNNGCVGFVKEIEDIEPNPANTISVSVGGSVLESFLQKNEYYSGRDLLYLSPKLKMTDRQMLYYCMILRANKYRYSYGRQANKTLADIHIPDISEIPNWVEKIQIPQKPIIKPFFENDLKLSDRKWEWFKYGDIFYIKNGYYNKKPDIDPLGNIPFIGASEFNNGIRSWHSIEEIEDTSKDGSEKNHDLDSKCFFNCLTISNDGSVGNAFYHPYEITCSHSVNPVYIKDKGLSPYIAMFLCTLIELEKLKWAYGRKWRPMRMPNSDIKLPVDAKGNPDWQFMEDYIKSLPYSKNLEKTYKGHLQG
ncbi:MAG: hypothetical protein B0D92_03925 [Spirochaeta sp. LUC14_002_19_P3]|nr:MAG: hypothetical protein B0D92_03925 [Spirochaeta sp. LUC14_002_19_P3]